VWERYLNKEHNETIIKVVTLLGIIFSLLILYSTGIAFIFDSYTKISAILHHLAAGVIVLLFLLHIWLRRCSAKRLTQEFFDILRHKQIHNEDNKSFIVQNIKNKPFDELVSFFHWDLEYIKKALLLQDIKIKDTQDTLKTIAKQNNKDLYDIFILITKLHIEKNTSEPITMSCC
jgi:hypothetical protein